ncbi:hypothetical protein [Winogradskyella sp. A2]|uniref:hypothetical protein n=1 Tax=Winogradskyella sp. A2 TaxID=3366944 RepID=UPI00398C3C43
MLKVLTRIKRVAYLFMVAWMLGVSNVILEETRMVHDTRSVIEQQEEVPDTDFDSEDLIL